jgi:hypothetical protein
VDVQLPDQRIVAREARAFRGRRRSRANTRVGRDARHNTLRYASSQVLRIRASLVCVCMSVAACATPGRGTSATPVLRAEPVHAATVPQPRAADASPDLFVRCEDPTNCPEAVGMLVVDSVPSEEPVRCTVTLIRSDRVITASHCLEASDRRAGASCARTWVMFPQTSSAPAESIACGGVVEATEVIADSALHQEHAVLQLERSSTRTPLPIDLRPLEPGSIVTVASVTPHPVYGATHALSTRLCRVIDATPAQRALGEDAGNVGWLANCPIARGNSGSPVIDYDGAVRAIVHGGTALSSGYGVTSVLAN